MSKYLKTRNQTMPESWAASHLVATCSLGLKASALEATGGCSTGDQPWFPGTSSATVLQGPVGAGSVPSTPGRSQDGTLDWARLLDSWKGHVSLHFTSFFSWAFQIMLKYDQHTRSFINIFFRTTIKSCFPLSNGHILFLKAEKTPLRISLLVGKK